jgi:hypothetical protein
VAWFGTFHIFWTRGFTTRKKDKDDEIDILRGMLGPAQPLNVFQTAFVAKRTLWSGNEQRLWGKFFFANHFEDCEQRIKQDSTEKENVNICENP